MEIHNKAVMEKLKKIYALVLKGEDGERQAAEKVFNDLCKKYEVALSDIQDDFDNAPLYYYHFNYSNSYTKILLIQIIKKVTQSADKIYHLRDENGKRRRNVLSAECTYEQKVEIDILYDFYKMLWEKELTTFMYAFCIKHKLERTLSDEEKERALNAPSFFSEDESRRMLEMVKGLSDDEADLTKYLMKNKGEQL